MQRHVIRKHADEDNSPPSESEPTREQPKEADSHPREMNSITLETVLSDAGVPNLMDKFVNKRIDVKLLLDLALVDLGRMLKDLDVNWGQRYKL